MRTAKEISIEKNRYKDPKPLMQAIRSYILPLFGFSIAKVCYTLLIIFLEFKVYLLRLFAWIFLLLETGLSGLFLDRFIFNVLELLFKFPFYFFYRF